MRKWPTDAHPNECTHRFTQGALIQKAIWSRFFHVNPWVHWRYTRKLILWLLSKTSRFNRTAGLQNEAQKLSFCCEQANFQSDILVM